MSVSHTVTTAHREVKFLIDEYRSDISAVRPHGLSICVYPRILLFI